MEEKEDPRLIALRDRANYYVKAGGGGISYHDSRDRDIQDKLSKSTTLNTEGVPVHFPRKMQARLELIVLRSSRSEFLVVKEDYERWAIKSLGLSHQGHSHVLDAPLSDHGPYTYLRLSKGSGEHRDGLLGYLIYDMDDCDFDEFWLAHADTIPKVSKLRRLMRSDEVEKLPDMAMIFGHELQGWLAEHYLRSVQTQATPIELQLRRIGDTIDDGSVQNLGSLLSQLNKCSRSIKQFELVQSTTFGLTAAHQAGEALRAFGRRTRANNLLALSSKMPSTRPARLKERIAELRAVIADMADQQRQEREDKRQQREEERQQRKDELRIIRDKQDAEYREREHRLQEMRDEQQRLREQQGDEYRAREERLQQLRDEIMAETRRDSRTMRGVAWMTMAFLPATFVSSFFGMNFFTPVPGKAVFDDSSRNVWVFFAVALPVSAVILTAFYWWDKKVETDKEAKQA